MISLYPPLFEGNDFPLASSGELGDVVDDGRMNTCMVRQTPLLHMCVHVQLAPLSVLDVWSQYGYHLSIIFSTHSTYFSV